MTGRTHILGGIAIASSIQVLGLQIEGIDYLSYYGLAVLGALLPDIDHPKSIISQKSFGLYKIFKKLGHRGATHSLLAAFILQVALFAIFNQETAMLGMGIGYLSHILLDMFNPRGVPLLYPVDKKKFKVAAIKTGESAEELVAIGLVIASLYNAWQVII